VRVAVIGAGAAGLVTARELRRRGFAVRVFEQAQCVGGVWVYNASTEPDPLGQHGARIHASLYASLRTNLPRDLMAFSDYPFDSTGGGEDHWPRFPGHAEVRTYLECFARDFDLQVEFGSEVTRVAPQRSGGWSIELSSNGSNGSTRPRWRFDAIAVCSGHYSAPRVPDLPGASVFPGAQSHSHNFREPSRFRQRCIALLGTAASGLDLSREIAAVATRVYWCGTLFDTLAETQRHTGNLSRLPGIAALLQDGRLRLRNGAITDAVDELIYCTGYHYRYPFLEPALVEVDDNWVQPLYRHLLHIEHPTLAFIGVPFRVVPFPLFELQARWFAALLDGDFRLPDQAALRAHTDATVAALRAAGVRQRHFHQLTIDCFDYLDALADECGVARPPATQRRMAAALLSAIQQNAGDVRDRPLPHFGPTRVPADSVLPV